ncbi:MAG: ATP-binding cassette domain-containing protein [Deltaproteobacteria bacterium]|jgi:ATP-binding cassette subfamily F protein 3|nr:ATP-binding cassette domain-containing protein [Deltaproteobacteria bacterium]
MLQVFNLSKSFGSQVLLNNVSFTIGAGERVGLVGRNGHGKTTLIKMILGEEVPDHGEIKTPKGYSIGHLSQHIKFSEKTVLAEGCLGLLSSAEIEEESYKVKTILHGLGFTDADFNRDPYQLSGGYQVRLNLVKILVAKPDLLLLDEPTNYLDIVSMRWLSCFLKSWVGEMLIITHDRTFMDSVVTHILGIHRGGIKKIEGTTIKYLEQVALEEEIYEKTRINQEKKFKETERFIERFRAKASKATAVQSRVKMLEKIDRLKKLTEIEELEFKFNWADFPGKWVIETSDIVFAYTKDQQPLISNLSFAVGKKDRIAIIGKNGKGKTTLLNLLAKELIPDSGAVLHSSNLKFNYFGQTNVERLYPENTVEEEILSCIDDSNKGRARGICGLMMFEGDAALKKVKVLSGGEKSRVLLGKILATKTNLLILDEPTNHLDLQSSEALIEAVNQFPGAVLIVTHNEELLHKVAKRLIVFDDSKVFLFEGSYQDFLDRVGWQGEEGLKNIKVSKESKNSNDYLKRKEQKKLRAELLNKKSKILNPLKKQIELLEKKIMDLESSITEQIKILTEISVNGFGDEAAKLSRNISKEKELVDRSFDELSELNSKFEKLSAEFEEELGKYGKD